MAPAQPSAPRDGRVRLYEPLREDVPDDDRAPAACGSHPRGLVAAALVCLLGAACVLGLPGARLPGVATGRASDSVSYVLANADSPSNHMVISKSSGKCLDLDRLFVQLKDCNPSSKKQMWRYDGRRVWVHDGRCLDAGGEKVHVWKCSKSAAIQSNQHWKYDRETGHIRHVASDNKCLQAGMQTAKVTMKPCDSYNDLQNWIVHEHAQHMQAEPAKEVSPILPRVIDDAEPGTPRASAKQDTSPHAASTQLQEPGYHRAESLSRQATETAAARTSPRSRLPGIITGCLCCLILGAVACFVVARRRAGGGPQPHDRTLKMDDRDVEAPLRQERLEEQAAAGGQDRALKTEDSGVEAPLQQEQLEEQAAAGGQDRMLKTEDSGVEVPLQQEQLEEQVAAKGGGSTNPFDDDVGAGSTEQTEASTPRQDLQETEETPSTAQEAAEAEPETAESSPGSAHEAQPEAPTEEAAAAEAARAHASEAPPGAA